MIEKRQRADRYRFPSRLGMWLMGMAMFLLSPATVKAARFDGQYQGTFSGEGSGSITFSVTGGVVSGSVSGSWGKDSISGSFSGSVSADGRMVTELNGTIQSPPSLEGRKEVTYKPTPFSGRMNGPLVVSGPSKDPSGRFPTAASGTWNASAIMTVSGSWRASKSTASPLNSGTMEKPVKPEPTEYAWADYARDFENCRNAGSGGQNHGSGQPRFKQYNEPCYRAQPLYGAKDPGPDLDHLIKGIFSPLEKIDLSVACGRDLEAEALVPG